MIHETEKYHQKWTNMCNGYQQTAYSEQIWNIDPKDKVAWKGTYCGLLQNMGYSTHAL
jgi:hypothetical protein